MADNIVGAGDHGMELAKRTPSVGKCLVCQLPYNIKGMVNRLAVNGSSYTEMARTLADLEREGVIKVSPSYASVRNHCQKHIKHNDIMVREILDRRAMQAKLDETEDVRNILTSGAVYEVAMNKGFQALIEGSIDKMTMKDVLEAAKLHEQFQAKYDGTEDVQKMALQMQFILKAIKQIVPAEYHAAIGERADKLKEQYEEGGA